ncbi:DNA polymerase beta superfamily protein [Conexibacter sp. SYSU D00693]|uniref:nucleotidyltransferase domain-containing protein n=1 Tax=Conexibacter sp. SYSU D00693 TaxID=2812560 RepID=UPI00196A59E0|nr:nucleotidyltransferase domain-containing protein [Conexibacter sp. SYSU D00693]
MEERSINTKEPDTDLARSIALDGLVLRGLVGSTVHGLSNPGTDDRDEMGVCLEPATHVVGLRRFDHYVSRTQPEGTPSGPGDLDLTVYGLRKFCRLALKGSPTVLLLLFVEGEHLLHADDVGRELQALAPAFLSQRTAHAFRGYVDAQRRGLVGERHATRTRELSAAHGYDTKYAMHALRIGLQGIELLATGRITLPMPEPHRGRLRAVRAGDVPLDDVLAELDAVTAQLEEATTAGDLPPQGDLRRVDEFLVDAHLTAWRR